MIIESAPLLALLREKEQNYTQDRSRHLLCPACRVRTKLYTLQDGRRKCSACGTKFNPDKKTDAARVQQYAELLVCFCLNLTSRQAATMTGYHYRLVSGVYERFRTLLASQNLTPGKLRLLTVVEKCDHTVHESEFCQHCRGRFVCEGRKSGDAPIFGVKILRDGTVFIDPLEESEATMRFDAPMNRGTADYSAYAGFICRGSFHRFTDQPQQKDGAERLWAWMSERLKQHHGIWKKNAGLYLKELEWKYNHRSLDPEAQARQITSMMPDDFLTAWKDAPTISLDIGFSSAASMR